MIYYYVGPGVMVRLFTLWTSTVIVTSIFFILTQSIVLRPADVFDSDHKKDEFPCERDGFQGESYLCIRW